MKSIYIDINCDVGEGIGNESDLLPLISSCNIACGGHAGDIATMTKVVAIAEEYRVKVGAHPSYPDRENFGRLSMKMSSDDLITSIQQQLERLTSVLHKNDIKLHHIKPHGALYNDIAKNGVLAKTFLDAIRQYKEKVFLYVPYGSKIASLAVQQNFAIKYEAFGDRNYNVDLSLVSRKVPNAVIEDPEKVLQHLLLIINKHQVKAQNSSMVALKADTFCIHGDTKSALQILMYLSVELPKYNIEITHD